MTELYHYGVLGMKWGVRKKRPPSQRKLRKAQKKAEKKEYRSDLKRARKAIGEPIRDQSKIDRLVESVYNDMHTGRTRHGKKVTEADISKFLKPFEDEVLYDELRNKKGEEYANKILRRAENELYAKFIASFGIASGVEAYLLTRGMRK